MTIPWDAKAHFYPQLQFLAQSLARGDSPFWTPNVFAGHPQIADPQSLIFSPPFLLLALFDSDPGMGAADAVVFGMLTFGGLGLLLMFRDRDWHPAGAILAALIFAFGASAAWRVQHIGQILSYSWFGMALFVLSRAIDRSSLALGILAGALAGLMAIGRNQVGLLGCWSLAGFALWRILAAERPRVAFRASLAPLLAGAFAGVAIVALPVALTLTQQWSRYVIDYEGAGRGSLHPASLFTFAVANLFGADGPLDDFWGPPSPIWGPVDLFLARNMSVIHCGALALLAIVALGLARGLARERAMRFFVVALVVATLYALGRYTPFYRIAYEIPGADLFRRPADATFLIGAFVAVLAGYATHRALQPEPGGPGAGGLLGWLAAAGLLIAIFAGAAALAFDKGRFPQARWPIAVAISFTLAAALTLWLARRLAPGGPIAPMALIAALTAADLAHNDGPSESTALAPAVYDALRRDTTNETIALLKAKTEQTSAAAADRRDRIGLVAIGFHWPNASLVHGLDNVLGYNPLRLALFTEATGAGDHVALADQRRFSPLFPSWRSPMADMLGLRFLATGQPAETIDKALKPGDLTLIARTADAFVYENPRALPRVLFATQAREADFAALVETGAWPDFDPSRTVLLEKAPGASSPPPPANAGPPEARILSYANTEIVVETNSATPGWLVLNDVWHPWWRASVDGAPAPILRANVLFRAVAAPAGRRRIVFRFEPFDGLWRRIAGGA